MTGEKNMETKKSPLVIYREKMAEVHTPEEIKAAFDGSAYADLRAFPSNA